MWNRKLMLAVLVYAVLMANVALAAISWSGDVDPSDPSTWNLNTEGYIGENGYGTMSITGGSDVMDWRSHIGRSEGSTGVVTVDGYGSSWTNSNAIHAGNSGTATLNITNGGTVSSDWCYFSSNTDSSSTVVTIDGIDSTLTVTEGLKVSGGTMNIINGGQVSSRYGQIQSSGRTSVVTVDGAGSVWTNSDHLEVGFYGYSNGTLNITAGGLVSVAGYLDIDDYDCFVNMSTGGKLALFGDADDSLAEFLGLVEGQGMIRYWDSSIAGWANITGATYGTDYTLGYITDGDLEGYTMLTVPEPATMLLFGLGGMLMRKR